MKLTSEQTSLIGMALRDKAKGDRKSAQEMRIEGGEVNLSYAPIFDKQADECDSLADTFDDAPYGATLTVLDSDD